MVIPTFSCFAFSILDDLHPCHIEPEKDRVPFSGFMLNSMGVTSIISSFGIGGICQIKILDLSKAIFERVTCISRNFYYLEVQDMYVYNPSKGTYNPLIEVITLVTIHLLSILNL